MQHILKVINVQVIAKKDQPICVSTLSSPDAFASFSAKLLNVNMTVKEDARVTRTGIIVQR